MAACAGSPSMETSGEADLRVLAGDGFLVGGDQRAFVGGEPLRPEEHLRRAQHVGVVAVVEHVAQDRVHELVDEQRRRRAHARAHEMQIGRLDGRLRHQEIAEADHQRPVLARVLVGHRRDLGRLDRPARIGQERRVQRALDHAGVGGGASSGRAR